MDYQSKTLAQGKNWEVVWKKIKGEESITLHFDNDTFIDRSMLAAMRAHRAWHLYCGQRWAGGSLAVFEPVADLVEKISLPSDKTTKIIGLDCLVNLKFMSVSGDVSDVDFRRFTQLRSLHVNERCKGGNWRLCESLDHLFLDVSTSNLTKLVALKNLRSLSVGRGLSSLEGAADLPALRELRIGGAQLTSLDSLPVLPKLRLLLLNLLSKLTTLDGIERAANLEELDVTQCSRLTDVSPISVLTKLKKLTLHFCPLIESLEDVRIATDCRVSFGAGGKVREGF